MSQTLGSRLTALRVANGFTERKLGEMFGFSQAGINHYMRDERVPQPEFLAGISKLFNVTIDYILTGNVITKGDRIAAGKRSPEAVGFADPDAARAYVKSAGLQSNCPEKVSKRPPKGLPIYHAYQTEIPAGWQALRVVLFQVLGEPHGSTRQDILAVVEQASLQFEAGVLLCRPGKDGREALQEFEDCASPEAAFLDQDGQYLQDAPSRPAFAVLPLASPNSGRLGLSPRGECLVLLPLIRFPIRSATSLPPMRLFVDGVEIVGAANA